mmetsp:Transcript_29367/g.44339  ORF Transcript_29367/g.44339 Transcript_29367/m.44339 type:complete len:92 (+) Transcript_29367:242-517(+)
MTNDRELRRKELYDVKLAKSLNRGVSAQNFHEMGSLMTKSSQQLPSISPIKNTGKIEDEERKRVMEEAKLLKDEQRRAKLAAKAARQEQYI